ncbi:conjugal transfer protein TraC [Burkholderia vietnamiensis]|uniref:conjugal transfer protein TraC n=1 Tax=Burkholderia vietnamiensis TaxID=60552 RepID=UPI00075AC9F5|nr:conjugal transfer protein TraC [Burkholderia vietnamiensis]KVD99659.1 conjugal transfer protein TraC [Burkholderia vietnamiensis]
MLFHGLHFHAVVSDALMRWLEWSSPWYWVGLAFSLLIVGVLHPVPWELPRGDESAISHALLMVRKVGVYALLILGLLVPFLTYATYVIDQRERLNPSAEIIDWGVERLGHYWMMPAAALVAGLVLRFLWDRYAGPALSGFWRSIRVTQETDKLVDAREEIQTLKAKSFEPEQYFVDDKVFYGLDNDDQPVYYDLQEFRTTHHLVLGPSDFGKGIILQSVFKQVIRFGFGAFYVDPKGDDWLPYLLQNEAKKAGRRFVFLDLRPEGKGVWHPFMGGSERERRTRITRAFNLDKSGTDSDVYKAKERALLDDALENTDGSIKAMLAYVKDQHDSELSMLRDSLREWSRISTFAQPGKRKGHSIEACLMNNAIVYVRGDLRDPVVKDATKAYIAELTGEINRLSKVRPAHVVFGVDELKFTASAEINEALATIRQSRCNMFLLGQSIANVESPDDKRLDGKALARELEVNTPIKFVYRAADERTAEWTEYMSAKQQLSVVQREGTEINTHGGEHWSGQRTIGSQEAAIISSTTALNLPRRVAIAFMPGHLATKLFTSPAKIDNSYASWEDKPADASAAAAQPAGAGESAPADSETPAP